ncbi:hypothetical protein Bp8pS_224 [Bacillus phage vB_BpuM-BpSp]|nr:hypothetical protein Bp8pS_224 [Bacillus phage vB_BpuM-BpSp]
MDNKKELFDKISKTENVSKEKSPKNIGRKVDIKVLRYEIDKDKDVELAVFIKNLINEHEITNQDVYDHLGRKVGWNYINGLKGGSVSWSRVKKWCEILGYDVEITLKKIK